MDKEKPTYDQLKQELEVLKDRLLERKEILDSLPVGIVVYDKGGTVHHYNNYFTKLLGYEKSDVSDISKWFLKAYPDKNYRKEIEKEWFSSIEVYNETGKFTPFKANVKCKDGSYKDIEFGFEAIGDTYLTTFVDISRQKDIEQALKESEEKYRKLYENANDAIFIMDDDVFIDCNNETLKMFECKREQIVGQTPYDFSPLLQPDGSPSKERAVELIRSALKKEIKTFEWMHKTYKNRMFYAEVSLNALPLKGKKYLQAIVRDINERKIAEIELEKYKNRLEDLVKERTDELQSTNEELKLTNDELQLVNKRISKQKEKLGTTLSELKSTQAQLVQTEKMASLGLLTAGVSHEINNPLNYIQAGIYSLETLLLGDKLDLQSIHTVLKHMQEGVNRVSNIVSSLNNFSKINRNKNERCEIHQILNDGLLMLDHQLNEGHEIVKKYHNKNILIVANEGKLYHVFINILQNAVQAIQDEGKIIIETALSANEKELSVSIEDTGVGISEENLSKIYDPFFTTKPPGEGTGLGLSIVFNIIKEHKGNINFTSKINKGTKVTITLPTNL